MSRIEIRRLASTLLPLMALALGLSGLLPRPALAQDADAAARALQEAGRRWIETTLPAPAAGQAPLRVEVSVGELDPRLRLAPCAKVEPFLPAGLRLWGSTRIGLRCADGATRWSVFLPVTVRAFGPAWVLRRPVAAGSLLAMADAEQTEVDWAASPQAVLADAGEWVGQSAAYSLTPGSTLRLGMVRPATLFQAGQNVRAVVQGRGFSIATDAVALGAGLAGQTVRVRTESGRVLTGSVLDGQTVRIPL